MKTANAPLEKKKPLFFTVGLIVALSVTLVSFEWRTPYVEPHVPESSTFEGEALWIPVTLPEVREKLEQPALPKQKLIADKLIISDNAPKDGNDPEVLSLDNLPEISSSELKSEEAGVPDETYGPISVAAEMPMYCGGEKAMFEFLANELEYPEISRMNGITGVVYIEFVVGKNGTLRDAKVIRSADPWLDAEALRVAKMLDCFSPGKQAGLPVDVYFRLPIRFSLGE